MKKKLIQVFRIVIAITFIFSALSKITSVTFFDGIVAELLLGEKYYQMPDQLYLIQIMTRFLIVAELFLGAAILQSRYLKKFILPSLFLMLIGFQIQLLSEGIIVMNSGKTFTEAFLEGNCGCFGDILPMNTLESLTKNLVALFMIGYLYRNIKKHNIRNLRFKPLTLPFLITAVTFLTLLAGVKKYTNTTPTTKFKYIEEKETMGDEITIAIDSTLEKPVEKKQQVEQAQVTNDLNVPEETKKIVSYEEKNKSTAPKKATKQAEEIKDKEEGKTTYNDILSQYTQFSDGVSTNLNKGDKLICMFSLSCKHCQDAYKAIVEMSKSNKLPNVLLLLSGTDFELNYFFNQAGGQHPYIKLENYTEFSKLLDGHDFPYILSRKNGKTVSFWDLESNNINESIREFYGIASPKIIKDTEGILNLSGEEENQNLLFSE